MAKTQPTGLQIKDASIQRDDLDPSTVGQAVIRKIVQGAGTILSSTGGDAGTGDVTVQALPRVTSVSSSTTPAPSITTEDMYILTALAAGATFGSPGTGVDGQPFLIRVKDNGSAQSLAWNAIYRASSDLALPTTTVLSKTLYLKFVYNATDSKWDLLALLNNF